jgi:hypothetical protein
MPLVNKKLNFSSVELDTNKNFLYVPKQRDAVLEIMKACQGKTLEEVLSKLKEDNQLSVEEKALLYVSHMSGMTFEQMLYNLAPCSTCANIENELCHDCINKSKFEKALI